MKHTGGEGKHFISFYDGRVQIVSQPLMCFNLFLTGCAAACGWSRGGALLSALSDFHILYFSISGGGKSPPDGGHCVKLRQLKSSCGAAQSSPVFTRSGGILMSPPCARHLVCHGNKSGAAFSFSSSSSSKKYLYPASNLLSSAALRL